MEEMFEERKVPVSGQKKRGKRRKRKKEEEPKKSIGRELLEDALLILRNGAGTLTPWKN